MAVSPGFHRSTILFILLTSFLGGCGVVGTAPGGGVVVGGRGRPTFNINGFGAVGDAKTIDTVAFQHAIEACRQAGGGTVYVPRGRYLVEPLDLVSNLTLQLDPNAEVLFIDDPERYPLVETRWEGVMRPGRRPCLWAKNCTNVVINGGTLDGQGPKWWAPVQSLRGADQMTLNAAAAQAAAPQRSGNLPTTLPSASPAQPTVIATITARPWESDPTYRRPPLAQFRNCSNVRIENVTFRNSPYWTLHLLFSTNVSIRDSKFIAPPDAPNTDAVDIDSCKDVLIERCFADVGEADAFALKSGVDDDGRRVNRATENVTIRNCRVARAHGGVVVGSEMSGGVRNAKFSDCKFEGTDVGIHIKSMRGRGGAVQKVRAERIAMEAVAIPFEITMRHRETDPEPASIRTPRFADIQITDVTARGATRAGIIDGLEESPVVTLLFRNLDLSARYGITCTWAADVRFADVLIATDFGPAMIRSNTADLRLDRWQETTPDSTTQPPVFPTAVSK
jgi:polygalacturonase